MARSRRCMVIYVLTEIYIYRILGFCKGVPKLIRSMVNKLARLGCLSRTSELNIASSHNNPSNGVIGHVTQSN